MPFPGNVDDELHAKRTPIARKLDTSPDAGYHSPRIAALKIRSRSKGRICRHRTSGPLLPLHSVEKKE